MALVDGNGAPLGPDALLQAAQRYGADEILVGRGPDAGAEAPLQWTLYTHAQNSSWNGTLAAAVDHTVDLLVPQQATSLAETEGETQVQIDGVNSLSAYANVERLLQSVPGVRRANVAAAATGSVTFAVTVRGGAAGLEQALSGVAHLQRVTGGSALIYRYQPQG
jgi:hypothetical protein